MNENELEHRKNYAYMTALAGMALLALEEICNTYDLNADEYLKAVDTDQLKAKICDLDSTLKDFLEEGSANPSS